MDCLEDHLEIDSRLTELSRVHAWIESVGGRLRLSEEKRFAAHLCVEEVVANVVMHGYQGEPGHPVLITAFGSDDTLRFRIDDQAPSFSPLEAHPFPPHADSTLTVDSIAPNGNGIRLLKRFSGSLSHERLPNGNRLTIGFSLSRDVLSA